jgi:hypothetical protein
MDDINILAAIQTTGNLNGADDQVSHEPRPAVGEIGTMRQQYLAIDLFRAAIKSKLTPHQRGRLWSNCRAAALSHTGPIDRSTFDELVGKVQVNK